jgi:hypothetical protein
MSFSEAEGVGAWFIRGLAPFDVHGPSVSSGLNQKYFESFP